ncbi:MAG: UbiA family prenyltransferase [Balneolaceae bacterium]
MTSNPKLPTTQLWHFVVHLRLHYQFFILSGGYLLASLFVTEVNWNQFWLQFLNVHVLLFGGATAYNSYWDKDEGPIGGLKSPPKMKKWMWVVSLMIQFIGIAWAWTIGLSYTIIYAVSFILFWLYSTPHARWKGHPLLSLIAIGFSTGTNSFLMGYLAAGGNFLSLNEGMIALGVACIILSLYPASQIFQIEEDSARGDRTFAMEFGLKGIQLFYMIMFLSGTGIISYFLSLQNQLLGLIFVVLGILAFIGILLILSKLEGKKEEYDKVMKIKFLASFNFVLFILSTLLIKTIIN